jgi:hypothetical protein
MGQSKQQKAYNQQMANNATDQLNLQKQMFSAEQAGTPEQQKFRTDQANWGNFISGKNYGAPPKDEFLNFDLYNPAHIAKQTEQARNLTGIGAAAMGGTGDQSIALQLSREHAANQQGEAAGAAYENAVGQTDAYYKGNQLAYGQLGAQQQENLLGNATNAAQFFFDQQRMTNRPSFMQTYAPLFGGLLQAGGALLGNPAVFGGKT